MILQIKKLCLISPMVSEHNNHLKGAPQLLLEYHAGCLRYFVIIFGASLYTASFVC